MDFGRIFRSKPEYSQDFFGLLYCLGKRAVFEWFMKEGMLTLHIILYFMVNFKKIW